MFDLILLDRDGVINEDSPHFVRTPEQWVPLPGSLAAIGKLTQSGAKVGVCTNQSGLARGYFTRDTLAAIHAKMSAAIQLEGGRIDFLTFCPHLPTDACACRKPLPGMLTQAMRVLSIAPHRTCFVGDSARDLQAASAAGCTPILVETGNGATTRQELGHNHGIMTFKSLAESVDYLRGIS